MKGSTHSPAGWRHVTDETYRRYRAETGANLTAARWKRLTDSERARFLGFSVSAIEETKKTV